MFTFSFAIFSKLFCWTWRAAVNLSGCFITNSGASLNLSNDICSVADRTRSWTQEMLRVGIFNQWERRIGNNWPITGLKSAYSRISTWSSDVLQSLACWQSGRLGIIPGHGSSSTSFSTAIFVISLPDLMAWKQFLFRISLGTQRKQNIISISGRSKDFSVSLRLEFQCFSNSKIKPSKINKMKWPIIVLQTDSFHIGTFHSSTLPL